MVQPREEWVLADFNGAFQDVLCLSHGDTVTDLSGREITLRVGLLLTACDEDEDDDGNPDWLLATGVVEPAPERLSCRGSKWVLRYTEHGYQRESDLNGA